MGFDARETGARLMRLFAKCKMNPAKALMTHEEWARNNPAAAQREALIEAKLCPPYEHACEKLCMCLVNGEFQYLIKPGIDLCDRCWQRAQARGLGPVPDQTDEEALNAALKQVNQQLGGDLP
jgi:hypothetical protein